MNCDAFGSVESMACIGRLPLLARLNVSLCARLDDAVLSALRPAVSLRHLDVFALSVTVRGVSALLRQCAQSLRFVDARYALVTMAQAARLVEMADARGIVLQVCARMLAAACTHTPV
jgi:hypothetical protein